MDISIFLFPVSSSVTLTYRLIISWNNCQRFRLAIRLYRSILREIYLFYLRVIHVDIL
jgi:hypothetical protein